MTRDRDIERLVSHWLDDGPTQVPDRVIEEMADRIGRQRQRPAWRFRWKELSMRPQALAAAALAAVVIVAVGGILLLRPSSNVGVGGTGSESPSVGAPTPTSSSSLAPSASAIASITFRPKVQVTVPIGWTAGDGDRTLILNPPAGGPMAGRSIGLMSGPFVTFKDPDCSDQAPSAVGTTVAEAVASLTGDPRLVVTTPQAVTIGGHAGQMVDLRVAANWTKTCVWSAGKGAVLIVSATTTGPAFGTGGIGRDRYVFLEVNGSVVAIDVGTPEGSDFEAFLAEATPIVQTIQFMP